MTQPTRPLPPPPESFFDELERAEARVLMLDYDGTLAPFRVEPSAARPYRGVRQLVGEIMFSGHTRLAIITGRPVKGFLDLLAVDPPPEVWGSFGWEHLNAGGSYQMSTLPEIAKDGVAESVMRANDAGFGSRIEAKPSSVSLHWRGLSAAASRKCREWAPWPRATAWTCTNSTGDWSCGCREGTKGPQWALSLPGLLETQWWLFSVMT